MLDRLSVGAKLSLAFCSVLLITALLGVMASFQLGRVNDTATDMAENWLPSSRAAQAINQDVTRFRTREYRMFLSEGNARAADADKIAQSRDSIEQRLNGYEKLVSSPAEGEKLRQIRGLWSDYLAHSSKMIDAARGGDEETAKRLLAVEGLPKYEALGKALDELVQINTDGANAADALGDEIYARSRWMMAGLSLLAVAIGGVLGFVITRKITRPLEASVQLAEAVAGGDLTRSLQVQGRDEVAQLQTALLRMVGQLQSVVAQVRDGVESVSSASSQIAVGNQDLSARTEQTASNLEETASSMEQLTGAVGQSADTARQANQLAGSAAESATRGGQVVGQVVTRMQEISASSTRIADIIGTIDGIAFQTNILALNAAVEAARAGEHGKGFAVVASEVRTLAQRSAEAAKEIKTLITRSVETVEAGSSDVAEAGRAMDEIVQGVRRVTDLMGEIAAASTEQRDGIAQVNQAVAHLDQMTQQNAALVEESTAASSSLREQAQRLAEVVSVFKVS
ncbi:methyl-accepting chemotaxis protein [Roseateles sp. So40a]|uniref:methyl-accepting chemotaxis protein n=1 Tax=Roseateles sp. So40a TaxID=3400226 RepID=UPI003A84AA03